MATLRRRMGGGRSFIATYDDENSPFKTFKSTAAVARALDLYWALENGYLWANANGYSAADYDVSKLMTEAETRAWADHLRYGVQTMWAGTLHDVTNADTGVNNHEVQAGNWPMMGFMGAAYAVMGFKDYTVQVQGTPNPSCSFLANEHPDDAVTVAPKGPRPIDLAASRSQAASVLPGGGIADCDDVLNTAIRHSSLSYGSYYGSRKRRYYWAHQTAEGNRMWAEGPYYFEIALTVALPYWHALRANDYHELSWPDDASPADPFRDRRVLDPLGWHADLVTADGRTVPLDDGNRTLMLASSLARWAPSYGDATTGRKHAWLHDASTRQDGNAGDWLHVQEIAIPRLARPTNGPTPSRLAPPSQITNSSGTEQQVLIRYASLDANGRPTNACTVPLREPGRTGACHVVLLNGEQGHAEDGTPSPLHAATTSGEGHEQPDGLQLLYSIDDRHVLDDAGYIAAPSLYPLTRFYNDGRNRYDAHNVLRMSSNMGGVQPPWQNEGGNRKNSAQRGVFVPTGWSGAGAPGARLRNEGPVYVMGGQLAWQETTSLLTGSLSNLRGRYGRTTLFVPGPEPYLIDINRGYVPPSTGHTTEAYRRIGLRYYLGRTAQTPESNVSNFQVFPDAVASGQKVAVYVSDLERSTDWSGSGSRPSLAVEVSVDREVHGALPQGQAGASGLNFPNVTAKRTGGASSPFISYVHASAPAETLPYYNTLVGFVASCTSAACDAVQPAHSAVASGTKADVQYYARSAGRDASGADLLDVVLVRSAGVYAGAMTRRSRSFSVPSTTYGANRVTLPSGNDEGFVRFRKVGSNWEEVDRYNVSVTPLRRLAASMSGPSSVQHNRSYTWSANASHGLGSGPTYTWEYTNISCSGGGGGGDFPDLAGAFDLPAAGPPGGDPTTDALPCGEWRTMSTSRTYRRRVTDERFKLRLTVKKGSETRVITKTVSVPGSGGGGLASEAPGVAALQEGSLPTAFALHAPAPNPVRGTAVVRYDLPEASAVRLAVYDTQGRLVRKLVSDRIEAGRHREAFEADGLAGGIYVVRLTAGAFRDTQTLTVVR